MNHIENIDHPQSPQPEVSNKETLLLYFLTVAGALISIIPDTIRNDTAAAILKIGSAVVRIHEMSSGYSVLCSFSIVIFTAIVLCAVYMPKTRFDAFVRGMAVLLVLTSVFPYNSSKADPKPNNVQEPPPSVNPLPTSITDPVSSLPKKFKTSETLSFRGLKDFFISTAYATDFSVTIDALLSAKNENFANATVNEIGWISWKKPEYSGFVGLGSFFGNTINIHKKSDSIQKGERIRIIEIWDTGLRGYRYVKIQYKRNGKILKGWIWAGKKPQYWLNVTPDDITKPTSEDIMKIIYAKSQTLITDFKSTNDVSKKKEIVFLYNQCFDRIRENTEPLNPDYEADAKLLRLIHSGFWDNGMKEYSQ